MTDPALTWTADGQRILRRLDFPGDPPRDLRAGDKIEIAADDRRQLLLGEIAHVEPARPGTTPRYLLRLWATVDLQDGYRRSHPPRERWIVANGLPRPTGRTYRVRRFDAARVEALAATPTRNRGPRHDDQRPARFGRRGRGAS